MGAKHRMTEPAEQRGPTTGPLRRALSAVAAACEIMSPVVLCAAPLTALLTDVKPEKPLVVASPGPPPAAQPVRQEGTVIAVSENSVTARSPNGYTQTYVVTPDTTVIIKGGRLATPSSRFAINDQIDIVGTIQGGTALATAVADRDTGHGDGPPMDFADPPST